MNLVKTGKLISKQRENKGLTVSALAKKLGVSEKEVTEWEKGQKAPDITLLQKLSKVLGVTSDELLSGRIVNRSSVKKTVVDVACGVALVLFSFVIWIIMMMKFHIFANGASVKVDLVSHVLFIAMLTVVAVTGWLKFGPHRHDLDE